MSLLKLLGEIFGIYRECPIVAEDVCRMFISMRDDPSHLSKSNSRRGEDRLL